MALLFGTADGHRIYQVDAESKASDAQNISSVVEIDGVGENRIKVHAILDFLDMLFCSNQFVRHVCKKIYKGCSEFA